jgi:hypothetical protein
VKLLIEQLEAGHSERLMAYLAVMGRFHNYSFGNILEIARQKPDATRVAGMYAWNQPVLVGFRTAIVFDVSQTDSAELPDLKERVKGDVGEYRERLIDFILAQGIELEFKDSIAPPL